MSLIRTAAAEVFSAREVARAAGVPVAAVEALITTGKVAPVAGYLSASDAVRCIRLLRRDASRRLPREIFDPPPAARPSTAGGLTGAALIHGVGLLLLALLSSLGSSTREETPKVRMDPSRLVFLATPGLGGGGGGGGSRQPAPPPKAEMKMAAVVKSPVPPPKRLTTRKPEPRRPQPPPVQIAQAPPRPAEPPPAPPRPAVTPQVVAPVVNGASDSRDRAGVLNESTSEAESQGAGSGGGVGTGQGSGIGEGTGSGIGPGSGGGTGGGPYRPGSGISPPSVLHEVRPDYTEEARRQGIEGDVLLEIVVRRDGSVGDVRVLQGLRGGLDRRAIDAVRQWKFTPAKRLGTPVDVVVEVAVEFKLR